MSIERLFKRKTSSKTRKTLERKSTDEQELLGVCIVLTEKVDEGILTEKQAVEIAEKLLRSNAEEIFLKRG